MTGSAPASTALGELLTGLDAPAYACIDGAVFSDLPALLSERGLPGRPLLRDAPGGEVQREGPWLVPVAADPTGRAALLGVMVQVPGRAGVIWSAAADEPSLYGHLRSLNHVRLPSGERVYFRQADPDVMNAVLPLLDAGQAARMLGPASALVFESEEAGGARRVLRPEGLPAAPDGELTFTDDQIDALNERQQHLSRLRIIAYLRETAPEHAGTRSEAELYQDVMRYERSAYGLGLSSERAIGKWAHLMAMSNETIGAREGPVREYLMRRPGRPDDKLETLITAMTGEAHRAEGSR